MMENKPKHEPDSRWQQTVQDWFRHVLSDYPDLEPHHVLLTRGCCDALSRAIEAREAIVNDGAYVRNRFGDIVKHPAIGVERDSLIVFSRLLRELDLNVELPAEAARPPALRSNRRPYAI